ncbi:MAG: hypothetical protein H0X33_06440 [Taibaiella sp.]|nr:hypothetical protein [Taibaiella sp.]
MLFLCISTGISFGQATRLAQTDTLMHAADSTVRDSINLSPDLLRKNPTASDTSKKSLTEKRLGIKISKDALPSTVKADAADSAVLDMQHNQFYLYGKAQVNYEDLQLNAGKITYSQANSIVTAHPLADSAQLIPERPSFSQGKEKFTYDSLQYNFKSKRAIVRNVRSQYGEGYLFSEQVKRNPDQSIYGAYSTYTTCALDTPHFGIVARRIKVIPGRVIASAGANIQIEGVPTPLFLPFGLFPISPKQHSGFLIPAYTVEQARGLGLTGGGYYFSLSDKTDLLTQANLYSKGSYSVSGISTYKSIYHYNGGISFSYAYNKTGEDYEPGATITKDFRIIWRHQTDPKATPGETFNASVDAGTSTFYSNNSYDPNRILQNQYSSNISYSKNWLGTPYTLAVSMRHSQNTSNHTVDLTLPQVSFYVAQFNPFQRKHSIGLHWYDKITASYTFDLQNKATFIDSTLGFNNLFSLRQFQNGVHHSIPISASYTVLRFINMSFSINYNEYWLTDKLYEQYNPTEGKIDSNNSRGFYTARDFNAGLQFTTRIYGLKTFKTGKIRGFRHVITPNVGFIYHPDFGSSPFNYYYQTYLDSTRTARYLSPYQTSIVGIPPLGKAGIVNFGIGNTLQMKVRSSKDTLTGFRNVSIIDGFSINSGYNLAADSFRFSMVSLAFRTNVLDKLNITANANYDPYDVDYTTGRRLPETKLERGDGIARFTNATLALGSNFHSKPLKPSSTTNSDEYNRLMRNNGYNDYVNFNIPWSLNISYQLSANARYSPYSFSDTITYSQNIMFNGDFNLTERWKVAFSSGYDFTYHQLTLTSIDVYRDLHCWAMHLQAIPFGTRKSYTFQVNVKATALQDLKLLRRRDYRDAAQ